MTFHFYMKYVCVYKRGPLQCQIYGIGKGGEV